MPLKDGMDDLFERSMELTRRREPHVLATVVWRRRPSSGKPGARAIITADGRLEGWIGGACSEPIVVREALKALETGRPILLCLGEERVSAGEDDGLVVESITCSSEGALEVFIEPRQPPPHLVLAGDTPLVTALEVMAAAVGFEVSRLSSPDPAGPPSPGRTSFVVIATMGHDDEAALTVALESPAPYIALVASKKRAEAVLASLGRRGLPRDQLDRVRAPAGLNLGHLLHQEIAVAILAEIVQLKASGLAHAAPVVLERRTATDPVCRMEIPVDRAAATTEFEGTVYYFCCSGCRERFDSDPEAYREAS